MGTYWITDESPGIDQLTIWNSEYCICRLPNGEKSTDKHLDSIGKHQFLNRIPITDWCSATKRTSKKWIATKQNICHATYDSRFKKFVNEDIQDIHGENENQQGVYEISQQWLQVQGQNVNGRILRGQNALEQSLKRWEIIHKSSRQQSESNDGWRRRQCTIKRNMRTNWQNIDHTNNKLIDKKLTTLITMVQKSKKSVVSWKQLALLTTTLFQSDTMKAKEMTLHSCSTTQVLCCSKPPTVAIQGQLEKRATRRTLRRQACNVYKAWKIFYWQPTQN